MHVYTILNNAAKYSSKLPNNNGCCAARKQDFVDFLQYRSTIKGIPVSNFN